MKILITADSSGAMTLRAMLEAAQRQVLCAPAIRTVDPKSFDAIDRGLELLASRYFTHAIFTSQKGVSAIHRRMMDLGYSEDLFSSVEGLSVGSRTAQMARDLLDLAIDQLSVFKCAAHLVEESKVRSGHRIFFPRSNLAIGLIQAHLSRCGIEYLAPVAYRVIDARPKLDFLKREALASICFLSPSAVTSFVKQLRRQGMAMPADAIVACIGSTTADRAMALGLKNVMTAGRPDIDVLAADLIGVLGEHRI